MQESVVAETGLNSQLLYPVVFVARWVSVMCGSPKRTVKSNRKELMMQTLQNPLIGPHPSYSWNSALATSNASHSIQNFNYLLQFHLWNSPSVSIRSLSTLYWHTNLCHPPCKHTKTFGERSFSYAFPSVWNNLPQTLCHSDSASSFKAALKTHLFNNYF